MFGVYKSTSLQWDTVTPCSKAGGLFVGPKSMDNLDPRIRSEAHPKFDKTKNRFGQILVDVTVEKKHQLRTTEQILENKLIK